MRKLTLNISPCPNDTFMFDALIHGRVDCEGLEFDVQYADIEQLNTEVLHCSPDISKISYAVFPQIAARYAVIDSGSALGYGNGPLLVGRSGEIAIYESTKIAIPGEHTTANLLMNRVFPQAKNKTPMLFSDIAGAVADGRFDAGVLIHEGRFTFADRGLQLVSDLGREWERAMGVALPLGGIVVARELGAEVGARVERVVRRSVEYAMGHRGESREFVKCHAQEMDNSVIDSHIEMFVNDFSISLGVEGRRAVEELLAMKSEDIFLSKAK